VLDNLTPEIHRRCLRCFRKICGREALVPRSLVHVPAENVTIAPHPFASGGFGDAYEGTLDGSKVCIKRVRVYPRDDQKKAFKARYWRCRFLCSPLLTTLTALLPRGRHVEIFETPKRRALPGYYSQSFPTHFGLDAWRGPATTHQGAPRCGPTWTRRCSSYCVYLALTYVISYLTLLRACATSTPAM